MVFLPNKIIIAIGERIDRASDLNAFAQTDRRFLQCVDPLLYARIEYYADEESGCELESEEIPSLAFRRSVKRGLEHSIRKVLNYGTEGMDAVLWVAADQGHATILSMLLAAYPIERYGTRLIERLISVMAFEGETPVLRALFESAIIDPWQSDMLPHLMEKAVRGERLSNAEYLLSMGTFDLNFIGPIGKTPLADAATNGSLTLTQMLLNTGRVDVDRANEHGETPFQNAVDWRHAKVVQALLQTGQVDVNQLAPGGAGTALCSAANVGDLAIAQFLLAADGIDINLPAQDGSTPLILAASQGHVKIVELLLARPEIDVEARENVSGGTALILAASMDNEAVVAALLARDGLQVDARDNDHWSALMFAAARGYEPVVELLLQTSRVDIHARDRHGRTPASQAKSNGQFAIYSMMMDYQAGGADLNNKI